MTRGFVDYLDDILNAILKAENFIAGLDLETFKNDEKTVFAVIRSLEIIGEAAGKIPAQIRKDNPSIPWKQIAGMRNKLIHEYFGVSTNVVWKTVNEELIPLKQTIKNIKEKMSS